MAVTSPEEPGWVLPSIIAGIGGMATAIAAFFRYLGRRRLVAVRDAADIRAQLWERIEKLEADNRAYRAEVQALQERVHQLEMQAERDRHKIADLQQRLSDHETIPPELPFPSED